MPFNLDDYDPVEDRLAKFHDDWPTGRVVTVLLDPRVEGQYIVRAEVFRDENGLPSASGLAEEREGSSKVNQTSALENCETSAIGRALANLGYAAKGKRPSREEMSKTSGAAAGGETRGRALGSAQEPAPGSTSEGARSAGEGRGAVVPSGTTSPAPGPAGTAGAGTTEPHPTTAPQAGGTQSPTANGEVSSATMAPGEESPVRSPASPGATNLGPDQPGPPHYPLRPDECDHRNEKSGHLLRPRKSPRGPVCPRCGLSYITVTESTTADLGAPTGGGYGD